MYLGCVTFGTFFWLPVYLVVAITIDFQGFPGFPVY